MLWFHGLGMVPLVDVDIPGVPNVEVCISRCEAEWFIAGGNGTGAFVPRDAEDLLGNVQDAAISFVLVCLIGIGTSRRTEAFFLSFRILWLS